MHTDNMQAVAPDDFVMKFNSKIHYYCRIHSFANANKRDRLVALRKKTAAR